MCAVDEPQLPPVFFAPMDAEEYLDRYGVTAYMKDVVTLLLENRPASPIAFIALGQPSARSSLICFERSEAS